jgi:hypothetical protein
MPTPVVALRVVHAPFEDMTRRDVVTDRTLEALSPLTLPPLTFAPLDTSEFLFGVVEEVSLDHRALP